MEVRVHALLRGVVQGVGMRPHVARCAGEFPITGWCGNSEEAVFIEAQGEQEAVDAFFSTLLATLPPLAKVIHEERTPIAPVRGEQTFRIVSSRASGGARTLLPPDTAICPACLADIFDPENRRYLYPFTTCTHCGPRLTIITDLPYDRDKTTMVDFPMCAQCEAEYTNPADRRYHAQPISCWDCGPHLFLDSTERARVHISGEAEGDSAVLAEAAKMLDGGGIVAILGLGGFHLACDGRNADAVARLRERKGRGDKPFAMMVRDAGVADSLVHLSPSGKAELTGQAHPIVIAPLREAGSELAGLVAPGLDDLGVMLPYTPMHALLFHYCQADALVMTSGNLSGEPLVYRPEEAQAKLGGLADYNLWHNRRIHLPVEDSVVQDGRDGVVRPIRRSRGYAPLPVFLEETSENVCVLAAGAELKNTVALTRSGLAFLSSHVGDMESLESWKAHERAREGLLHLNHERPERVVVDMHPSYLSSQIGRRFAGDLGVDVLEVQHHHAHGLALLADRGMIHPARPVPVASVDGTGYGLDGTIWGGEVLLLGSRGEDARAEEVPYSSSVTACDITQMQRLWHVPSFLLVGGDSAVKNSWKVAEGLIHAWGLPAVDFESPLRAYAAEMMRILHVNPRTYALPEAEELKVARACLNAPGMAVKTSSLGRLFDAVSSILGITQRQTYEGQAAMQLEAASWGWVAGHESEARALREECRPLADPANAKSADEEIMRVIARIIERVNEENEAPREVLGYLAAYFHEACAAIMASTLARAALWNHSEVVGLTGGVALNRHFASALKAYLEPLTLLEHSAVPATDGGLALGQALYGYLMVGKEKRCA